MLVVLECGVFCLAVLVGRLVAQEYDYYFVVGLTNNEEFPHSTFLDKFDDYGEGFASAVEAFRDEKIFYQFNSPILLCSSLLDRNNEFYFETKFYFLYENEQDTSGFDFVFAQSALPLYVNWLIDRDSSIRNISMSVSPLSQGEASAIGNIESEDDLTEYLTGTSCTTFAPTHAPTGTPTPPPTNQTEPLTETKVKDPLLEDWLNVVLLGIACLLLVVCFFLVCYYKRKVDKEKEGKQGKFGKLGTHAPVPDEGEDDRGHTTEDSASGDGGDAAGVAHTNTTGTDDVRLRINDYALQRSDAASANTGKNTSDDNPRGAGRDGLAVPLDTGFVTVKASNDDERGRHDTVGTDATEDTDGKQDMLDDNDTDFGDDNVGRREPGKARIETEPNPHPLSGNDNAEYEMHAFDFVAPRDRDGARTPDNEKHGNVSGNDSGTDSRVGSNDGGLHFPDINDSGSEHQEQEEQDDVRSQSNLEQDNTKADKKHIKQSDTHGQSLDEMTGMPLADEKEGQEEEEEEQAVAVTVTVAPHSQGPPPIPKHLLIDKEEDKSEAAQAAQAAQASQLTSMGAAPTSEHDSIFKPSDDDEDDGSELYDQSQIPTNSNGAKGEVSPHH